MVVSEAGAAPQHVDSDFYCVARIHGVVGESTRANNPAALGQSSGMQRAALCHPHQ